MPSTETVEYLINCASTHCQNEVPLGARTRTDEDVHVTCTVPASAAHDDIDNQPRVSSESDSESDVTAHMHASLIAFVNCYSKRNCVHMKGKYKKIFKKKILSELGILARNDVHVS